MESFEFFKYVDACNLQLSEGSAYVGCEVNSRTKWDIVSENLVMNGVQCLLLWVKASKEYPNLKRGGVKATEVNVEAPTRAAKAKK